MGTFTSLTTFQRLNIHKFQRFFSCSSRENIHRFQPFSAFKQREQSQVSTIFDVQTERTFTGFNRFQRSSRENNHRFQPYSTFRQREHSQVSTVFNVQAEGIQILTLFSVQAEGTFTSSNHFQRSSRENIHKFQPFSTFKQREYKF